MSEAKKMAEMLWNFIQEPELWLKQVTLNRFRQKDSESFYAWENWSYTEQEIQNDLNTSEKRIIDFFEWKWTHIVLIDTVKEFYNNYIYKHLQKFLLKTDREKWQSHDKGYFLDISFGKDSQGETIIKKLRVVYDKEEFDDMEKEIAQKMLDNKHKQEYLEKNGIQNRIKTINQRMKLKQAISLEKFQKSLEDAMEAQKKILWYFEENILPDTKWNTFTLEVPIDKKDDPVYWELIYNAAILYLHENEFNTTLFNLALDIFSGKNKNSNQYKVNIVMKRRQSDSQFYIEKVDLSRKK